MNPFSSYFDPKHRSFFIILSFLMILLLTNLVACQSRQEPNISPTEAQPTFDLQDDNTQDPSSTTIPLPEITSVPNDVAPTPVPTAIIDSSTTDGSAPAALLPEQYVEVMLGQMSVEEKIGQLFLVYFVGPALSADLAEMISTYHVGGILFFRVSDNIQSLQQVAHLIDQAQTLATSQGAKIPLFVGIDHEGGSVMRLRNEATLFPSNMAIGATWNPENAAEVARISALELRALGINMNLAPVVDVNNNPANPVIGIRSFGSSSEEVAKFGQAMIESYNENGIIATAKHFPGHGNTSIDSHVGLPIINHDISEIELKPFDKAIKAGVPAIMTAHMLLPAYDPSNPATLSERILKGLLQGEMKFNGLIVTDSLGMGALTQQYSIDDAAVRAFQAGADVLAFGPDSQNGSTEQRLAYQKLLELVNTGQISPERLDQSVRRILLAKAKANLLDWKLQQNKQLNDIRGEAHTIEARRIAQESITLVKDDPNLIPLLADQEDQSVLVIWPTYTGDLASALSKYHPDVKSLQVDVDPTAAQIQQAQELAKNASSIVIATVNINYYPAQAELVKALSGHNPIVTAVGSPYDLMQIPDVKTYLASYGHVPDSIDALAKVLAGVESPTGRLPVELPGLYALGHGLTR